jgi:hypothetical protein
MTALPQDDPSVKRLRATALSAYNVCLKLEELTKTKTEQEQIRARVLGYLILHIPSVPALDELEKVIKSCNNDHEALLKLGESFINYYIRPCKSDA